TIIEDAETNILDIEDGIEEPTQFRFTAECESGTSETTDPIEINLTPGEECYCIPEIMVGCILGDRISNITLSGETIELNNDSQCSSGQEGYEDYTNDNEINIPDLQQGETYTLSVSTGSITPSEEHVRAWIDYNGNGNFSDN